MSILCYHAIDESWDSPLAVRRSEFERHCRWIARRRAALPLDATLRRIRKDGRLPPGSVHLSFDDGFQSLYESMWPVVRRHGLASSVFLVAETLTPQGRPVDWVDNPPPIPPSTLTIEQILEMQDAGVDFQSHSWAHRDLTALDYWSCREDLRCSRELLQDLLRKSVTVLAYPRGRHDRMVREAAKAAGYTHGLALPERREPVGSFAIPRVGIYRGNGAGTFRLKATSAYARLRHSELEERARSLRRQ